MWSHKEWIFLPLTPGDEHKEVLILMVPFWVWDNENSKKKKIILTAIWVLNNSACYRRPLRNNLWNWTFILWNWTLMNWNPIIISFVPWDSFLCRFPKNSARSVHLSAQAYQSSSTLSLCLKIKKLIKKAGWIRICISDQQSFKVSLAIRLGKKKISCRTVLPVLWNGRTSQR